MPPLAAAKKGRGEPFFETKGSPPYRRSSYTRPRPLAPAPQVAFTLVYFALLQLVNSGSVHRSAERETRASFILEFRVRFGRAGLLKKK